MLSQYDVAYLKDCGIACTKDDYKYEYTIKDGTYGMTGQGWEESVGTGEGKKQGY